MVRLEFHDPCGALQTPLAHAPRLASLAGRRIGLLSK
jgi:hypothetical protein